MCDKDKFLFRFDECPDLALFAYEMLITLDEEIETIWKRRITLPSILYLVMRVGTLGYLILNATQAIKFFGLQSLVVRRMSAWTFIS